MTGGALGGDLLGEAGAEVRGDDVGDELGGGAAGEVGGGLEVFEEGLVRGEEAGVLEGDGADDGALAGEGVRGHGLDGVRFWGSLGDDRGGMAGLAARGTCGAAAGVAWLARSDNRCAAPPIGRLGGR